MPLHRRVLLTNSARKGVVVFVDDLQNLAIVTLVCTGGGHTRGLPWSMWLLRLLLVRKHPVFRRQSDFIVAAETPGLVGGGLVGRGH